MIFHTGKKKKADTAPPITFKELEDLPYADNFDLPREEERLRAVYEHERSGGSFDIRKVFSSKGMKGKTIAKISSFPACYELLDMVEESHGGCTYNVHPSV